MVGEAKDPLYLEMCLEEGATHIEPQDRVNLRRLYANCACFVLNSKAEIQPLTIMEAGAQAKSIVVANGCLWKAPNALWVECDNKNQIKAAINKAIVAKPNTELRDWLKDYTWDKVADRLIEIYQRALDKHKNEPAFIWKTDKPTT
jgi:glycosyltransferase involved in cell wall biosynthesis